jgi:hypothetical protein
MSDFNDIKLRRYDSVGGWLLLLCIALTIGSPIRTLYNLFTGYEPSSMLFEDYPDFKTIYYIDLCLSTLLMALSIRAGIALWKIWPGAVKIAKNYLWIFLGYSIISSILPFMAGLPNEANEIMIPEILKAGMQSVIYFIIWYWYLMVSKRVKATYFADPAIAAQHEIQLEPDDSEIAASNPYEQLDQSEKREP